MSVWSLYRNRVQKNCLVSNSNLNGLAHLRNQLFFNIILYLFPLSIFSAVPGVIMSFLENKIILGLCDIAAIVIGFVISFNSHLKIDARKILFILLLYILAITLIYYLGSFGPGLLYLLVITIFCLLIFSNRVAYISVIVNSVICILFGLALYFKVLSGAVFRQYTIGSWIAVSANMVILSLVVAILLPLLFNGLQQSNDRYEMVARATSDTVCDWDLESDVKVYNEGADHMFGYKNSEIGADGKWWTERIHPDDKQRVKAELLHNLRTDAMQMQTEYRFRCADDTYKHILYRSYILRNKANKPIRVISAMQDVSERNNYINAIEEQNKRLKEISWKQSHIVRAPLTRIMGLVSLLMDIPKENLDTDKVLEYIMISANEFDEIVKDLVKNAEIDITHEIGHQTEV